MLADFLERKQSYRVDVTRIIANGMTFHPPVTEMTDDSDECDSESIVREIFEIS